MEALDIVALQTALGDVFTVQTIFFASLGVVIGISVGAIPGLAHTLPIAMVLPFAFVLDLAPFMGMLIGTYTAGTYGGSITAIAFGTPGTASASATVADGYALTQAGKGKKALQMALYASLVGASISAFFLIFLVVPIGRLAPRFGPAELTALFCMALALVVVFAAENPGKGIMSAGIGFFLAVIGRDPITAGLRFTFGLRELQAGFPLVPLLMGFFAVPVIIKEIGKILSKPAKSEEGELGEDILEKVKKREEGLTLKEFLGSWKAMGVGSLIGTFLGALPGPGAVLASYTSYSINSQLTKDKNYGKGSLDGIAAAEAGNNGTCSATFIPMLTFGIPGSSISALLMAALIMQGVPLGPRVVIDHTAVVYTLFLLLLIAVPAKYIFGRLLIPVFSTLTKIPAAILWPIITVFLVIGIYAYDHTPFHIVLALAAGLVGYFYNWYKLPPGPMILAFLVAPLFERAFRNALTMSRGNPLFFIRSNIAFGLWLTTVVAIVLFVWNRRRLKKQAALEEGVDSVDDPK